MLRKTRQNDVCEKCEEELAGGIAPSAGEGWKTRAIEAIEAAHVARRTTQKLGKASLWDLFGLDPHNGGKGVPSELGDFMDRLDPATLYKVSGWLDDHAERAIQDYGYVRWRELQTFVRLSALFRQMPPDLDLTPDNGANLPIQVVAVRADGKKWDLNTPIQAELLRRLPRFLSERVMARLLGIRRSRYKRMRKRMEERGFSLGGFTSADLEFIVRGKQRGRKPGSGSQDQ